MGGLGNPVHLLFIAVVALVVLGPKRLPEVAKTLGSGLREFRETLSGMSPSELMAPPMEAPAASPEAPAASGPVPSPSTPPPPPPVDPATAAAPPVGRPAPATPPPPMPIEPSA
jgi:sec-independent protein translocase protein TatA